MRKNKLKKNFDIKLTTTKKIQNYTIKISKCINLRASNNEYEYV